MLDIQREIELAFDAEVKEVNNKILGFSHDLTNASPVDTGNFRKNWKFEFDNETYKWSIVNITPYGSILYHGRRFVNGKWYGSEQLADGYEPMLQEFVNDVL